jgi:hypothetical protein
MTSTRHLVVVTCLALLAAGPATGVVAPPLAPAGPPVEAVATADGAPPAVGVVLTDQSSDGRSVVVESVTLPGGGYVAVHDETFPSEPVRSVIGVTDYLPPGTHEDVSARLFEDVPSALWIGQYRLGGDADLTAVAHRDTDDDQEFGLYASEGTADTPYLVDGVPAAATARVTVVVDRLYWQADFIAGTPYPFLGTSWNPAEPTHHDDFYADPEEDRLFRWAHGDTADGLTTIGRATPDAALRTCVEPRNVREGPDGEAVQVTFTVAADCAPIELTLAVYEKEGPGFDRTMKQKLVSWTTDSYGPGTHTVSVPLFTNELAPTA